MDFGLSDGDRAFQERVRAFANDRLAGDALRRVHDDSYPHDVARMMAEEGLLGLTIPVEDGGRGGTLLQAILAIEAVSEVCPKSADVLQVGNFGPIRLLSAFGTEDQKQRYLAPLLRGELVFTVAMTEPEAGSAVTDLEATATADGEGLRVSGTKVYTTHGLHADVFLVYVRYAPGVDGIGSVLMERGAEGISLSEPVRFLSGEEWVRMEMRDVRIEPEDVFLREGGFRRQIEGFNVERLGNAARSLGLGRCAFRLARDHALTRTQFGRALCEFQGLQWGFADQEIALQAAQLLLYRAACNADRGFPSALETAIAKTQCNLAGFGASDHAMQVMGAMGYSESTLVEFCFRRTRGWMIAGGSVEMMKNRIAESIFGRRFSQRPPRPRA